MMELVDMRDLGFNTKSGTSANAAKALKTLVFSQQGAIRLTRKI
ncbi:hypothetical protein [Intestinimonas butyriciproducens]|nr:hypothetical protein [Intestinimonas butyriciproducens]